MNDQPCIRGACSGPDGEGRKCVACGGCCNWPQSVHWTEDEQQALEPGAVVSVLIGRQWLTARVGWVDHDALGYEYAVLDGWWRREGEDGRYRIWIGFDECGGGVIRLRGESMRVGESSGGLCGLHIKETAPKQGALL